MPIRLAIIGATGDVGRAVAIHVLRSKLLRLGDRLMLIGRDTPESRLRLIGFSIDLQDAFDDLHVPIDLVSGLEAFDADIIVVAAGETVSPQAPTRRDLAERNVALFDRIGLLCAARLPRALFIVVSNPVELAVERLARHTNFHRVMGMGAQQDSLRFARAVATDLGISRHDVRALAVGEHGGAMVPLWSEVRLVEHARRRTDLAEKLEALREQAHSVQLEARVEALRADVIAMLLEGRGQDAFAATRAALPDARVFVEPIVTNACLHSTAQATANATLAMLFAASGRPSMQLAAQVPLCGEAFGIHGVCGLPVTIDTLGWCLDRPERFDARSVALIQKSAQSIQSYLAAF